MKMKEVVRAAGLAAALVGGEACKPDKHPDRTFEGMSDRSERPRALSNFPEVVQREFSRWQERVNHLYDMQQAGVTVQEIRPVHVPGQLSGLEDHPRLLRFEVIFSDGRARVLDEELEARVGFGERDQAQVLFRALENARSQVVAFAREK